MDFRWRDWFELSFAVIVSGMILVGTVVILSSLGGCGGAIEDAGDGVEGPAVATGSGDGGQLHGCVNWGSFFVCDTQFVDDLRDTVRRLEEELRLAEELVGACEDESAGCADVLGTTGGALSECLEGADLLRLQLEGCSRQLGTCSWELGTCAEELETCTEDYNECAQCCPAKRVKWWLKHCRR